MSSVLRALLALLVTPLLTGCTATEAVPPRSGNAHIDSMPRTRHDQAGIEMLTWHLKDSDTFDGILARHTDPALTEASQNQFATNALTVTRLHESQLGSLLTELGGTNAAMSTWCGQVIDWRDLRDVRVSQAIIEINGQPLLLDSGQLSMAARAWVEPTLDSARLHVEVLPRYRTDRQASPSILRSARPQIHQFVDMVASTDVAPGEVLLVTCTVPPSMVPVDLPPEPSTSSPTEDSNPDEFDPDDDPAFDTPIPRTKRRSARSIDLGHALFSIPLSIPGEPPERVVIVLVPRIPPGLIPDKAPTAPTQAVRAVEVGH